jgi:Anti-sigma factor NepR
LGELTPVHIDDQPVSPDPGPVTPRPSTDTPLDRIGANLRRLYADALDEDVPDPFKDLLDKLR